MSRYPWPVRLAISCMLMWAGASFAQERGERDADDNDVNTRTVDEDEGRNRSRRARDFHQLSGLYGTEIRVRDDAAIGTIEDIFIDSTGRIAFVATGYNGAYLPIPFAALSLSSLGDGFVYMDIDRDLLNDAPTFSSLVELRGRMALVRSETFFRNEAGLLRLRPDASRGSNSGGNSAERQEEDRDDRGNMDDRGRGGDERRRFGDRERRGQESLEDPSLRSRDREPGASRSRDRNVQAERPYGEPERGSDRIREGGDRARSGMNSDSRSGGDRGSTRGGASSRNSSSSGSSSGSSGSSGSGGSTGSGSGSGGSGGTR